MPDGADVAGPSDHDFNADGGDYGTDYGVHDTAGDYTTGNVGFAGADIIQPDQVASFQSSLSDLSSRFMNNLDVKNFPGAKDVVQSLFQSLGIQVLKKAGTGKPFSIKDLVKDGIKAYIATTIINQSIDIAGDYNQQIRDIGSARGEALRNTFADKFLTENSGLKNVFDNAVENITNSVTLNDKCAPAMLQKSIKTSLNAANDLRAFLFDDENRKSLSNIYKRLTRSGKK